MRILVAGGAGFIGSHYVRTLISGGYPGFTDARVTVLDKLTYAGNLANLQAVASHPRFTFIRGDICDAALVGAVARDHDIVINFAAETHVDRSIVGASDFVAANVAGVQVLLQARAYFRTHGLDVLVTRCVNNYGPYQFPEKVIPLFATNLLDGLAVPLYGDGGNVRGWIHVDDHCRGIQLVLERGQGGGIYHIGGDVELTNIQLTQALLDCCGASWDMVTRVEDRKGHDRRYSLDDSALRALGYAPRTPFPEGLRATVQWYRDNRSWWEPLKPPPREPGLRPAARAAGATSPGIVT